MNMAPDGSDDQRTECTIRILVPVGFGTVSLKKLYDEMPGISKMLSMVDMDWEIERWNPSENLPKHPSSLVLITPELVQHLNQVLCMKEDWACHFGRIGSVVARAYAYGHLPVTYGDMVFDRAGVPSKAFREEIKTFLKRVRSEPQFHDLK